MICGESPNPTTPEAIAAQAAVSYQRAGLNAWPFGAMCPGWTVTSADTYLGPWNTPTPVPVLDVVSPSEKWTGTVNLAATPVSVM